MPDWLLPVLVIVSMVTQVPLLYLALRRPPQRVVEVDRAKVDVEAMLSEIHQRSRAKGGMVALHDVEEIVRRAMR
jgi:hypothetical protein